MKTITSIEFEVDDLKFFSTVLSGRLSKEDIINSSHPQEVKEIAIKLLSAKESVFAYEVLSRSVINDLKAIPIELRKRYFSDFIKCFETPEKIYDCEGKSVVGYRYHLLE